MTRPSAICTPTAGLSERLVQAQGHTGERSTALASMQAAVALAILHVLMRCTVTRAAAVRRASAQGPGCLEGAPRWCRRLGRSPGPAERPASCRA